MGGQLQEEKIVEKAYKQATLSKKAAVQLADW